jgi:hypothetical protein
MFAKEKRIYLELALTSHVLKCGRQDGIQQLESTLGKKSNQIAFYSSRQRPSATTIRRKLLLRDSRIGWLFQEGDRERTIAQFTPFDPLVIVALLASMGNTAEILMAVDHFVRKIKTRLSNDEAEQDHQISIHVTFQDGTSFKVDGNTTPDEVERLLKSVIKWDKQRGRKGKSG